MSVLNNAVMSIQVGLEDLATGTPPRMLSSVRNLHAGVLLLLKACLLDLSPEGSDEVLLKQKIQPRRDDDGRLEFTGSGKKTVDVEEIKQRLTALGVQVDWKRIDRLTRERNNIEHYYPQVSDEAMRGLAVDVLVVIRGFTSDELGRDPRELFGDDAWEHLLKNKEVSDAERAACVAALRSVPWQSETLASACEDFPCPDCASRLWYPADPSAENDDRSFQCRACGKALGEDEFVEQCLDEHCAYDAYRAIKDGGEDPLADCPNCFLHTYVVEEGACARCGYEREYTECLRCSADIGIEEQELGGLCGYCAHVMGKDD